MSTAGQWYSRYGLAPPKSNDEQAEFADRLAPVQAAATDQGLATLAALGNDYCDRFGIGHLPRL